MIRDRFSKKLAAVMSDDRWMIEQDGYNPDENLKYESLFALSNGYMGIRGSYEEGTKRTLPYVYINGVFDKSETFMRELATLPNWLGIRMYVEKELIGAENGELLEFARVLDMKHASLLRRMILRDRKGRETLVEGIRFVSRKHVHRMGIRLYVTPLNYSGILEIENLIDGTIYNFYDAPRFKVKHTYMTKNERLDTEGAYVEVATRDHPLHVGCGCRMEAVIDGRQALNNQTTGCFGEQCIEFGDVSVEQGQCVEITKYVSMYTERDCAREQIKEKVADEVAQFAEIGFESEWEAHKAVYQEMWEHADIEIDGDFELNRAIRFNIFHLMSTGNEHDSRVNVGAKLLSGEEYGGHAFWDTELFMLPFFAHVFPETAKNLEQYRFGLLEAAKANARKNGYQGAQYPWESADDGTEQCPAWTIEPDGTCYRCYVAVYEHHVTAAVAYGICNYAKITGDEAFLYKEGAQILIETARFWADRCEYNEEKDRYEIRQVTGPDEWHEPVDNNLYTNYLARWNLTYVMELLDQIRVKDPEAYKERIEESGLSDAERQHWQTVAEKIYLPKKEGTRLLEQFEGYFDLENVTIEAYDENDWPIRPEALKHKKARETQIIKQADVVMLLHLMGKEFSEETIKDNYHYYEKRTLHGSSLSPSIYSIMGLKVGDSSKAYRYLKRAAFIDLLDMQGNTREGIHAANTGGVWQTVVYGFAGVSAGEEGTLHIMPRLPKEWKHLRFRLHYAGTWLEITVTQDGQTVVRRLAGEAVKVKTKKGIRLI